MIANITFFGIMAPVFTIFNQDFSVNTERIPDYAHYLLDAGINAILVAGSTGEGTSLSLQERKNLTEAWAEAVKKTSQSLMIQVGGGPFPDVVELARHADSLGVDAILTLPELYFKPKKTQELISYLKFVSAAAPNTPLFYYHYPTQSGVNIDMGEFLEQANGQIPNLKGIKYTSSDLAGGHAALRAANGKYTIIIGGEAVIEPALALGFTSAMAGAINMFPRYVREMFDTIQHNKLEIAAELQRNLTEITNIVSQYGAKIAGLKLAMNLFTPINVGLARPPLQNPSPYKIEEIKKRLEPFL
ncbi:N-acetylneuraminate lyase [Dendroctonus ponderosae]|uniref:N-acetylneuraminate lyase n=1 Tax=Dendroctonus ponderosae TaxID=77166 RepID=UPI002034B4C6|nr:N-acetylneuraminate lyase [Dendroctonus ponderosae]KAH1015405.1 hypothetical protein HUJ05_013133 [Dendroctonus ponderosae]KAH1015406.1 hypothetical protein HUJ05_013133 [Dendroctonus ponderosae]